MNHCHHQYEFKSEILTFKFKQSPTQPIEDLALYNISKAFLDALKYLTSDNHKHIEKFKINSYKLIFF